jgi:hypothetical protein
MQGLSWHFAQVGCVWLVPPRQLAACASQNEASEDTWLHPTRADAGGGFATDGSFGGLCNMLGSYTFICFGACYENHG